MSKLVYGSAEDLLSTLCVASEAPIIISPAMNSVMWANKAVEENKKILNERGENSSFSASIKFSND